MYAKTVLKKQTIKQKASLVPLESFIMWAKGNAYLMLSLEQHLFEVPLGLFFFFTLLTKLCVCSESPSYKVVFHK